MSPSSTVARAATTVTRDDLYREVWETPLRKLAETYGVSDVALAKVCRKLNVPVPTRVHWANGRLTLELKGQEWGPDATFRDAKSEKLEHQVGAIVATFVTWHSRRNRKRLSARRVVLTLGQDSKARSAAANGQRPGHSRHAA